MTVSWRKENFIEESNEETATDQLKNKNNNQKQKN